MGAKVDDSTFRTIFISLLGEEWDAVVPILHTFRMSAEVISFITMHAERLSARTLAVTPATALAANTQDPREARRAARRNLVCSNAQCGAPGRKGHSISDCFWPGGGKEGQWPAWWKGKKPTIAPTAAPVYTGAGTMFALSAWTTPDAIVSVYDSTGTQAVNFCGEEILGSPESLMAWGRGDGRNYRD
ncbi:hypothetical protein B0H14DRAFT_537700 [Mycena olivaceomarginata]|nr:hypothetical protein B0H14DRAFT_537700 [Mycena olivaceomarginata]